MQRTAGLLGSPHSTCLSYKAPAKLCLPKPYPPDSDYDSVIQPHPRASNYSPRTVAFIHGSLHFHNSTFMADSPSSKTAFVSYIGLAVYLCRPPILVQNKLNYSDHRQLNSWEPYWWTKKWECVVFVDVPCPCRILTPVQIIQS